MRALAEQSITLADEGGHLVSPWACLALVVLEWSAADYVAMQRVCERALRAAEARGDEIAACVASSFTALVSFGLGDDVGSTAEAEAALMRAERLGHPDAIRSVVNTVAIRFISSDEPDFASCYSVLNRYERFLRADDALAVYLEGAWGSALLGLGRPGAVEHLARAVRVADRLSVMLGMDIGLRQLAAAAGRAGYRAEAAMLAGYAEANLHTYPRDSWDMGWHQTAIEEALGGMTDRAEHEAIGRAMTRRQVMAMVGKLDTTIDHP